MNFMRLSRRGWAVSIAGLAVSSLALCVQAADNTGDQDRGLSEIVVTAQKREERLQDVPIPVTVVNTESLVSNNKLTIADYYTEVPGLSISPSIQSNMLILIRGISGGPATVGIMVDGAPFGATTGIAVPDFDPGDLQRIEVLRGPQGTLWGASGLGGLINFVTVDPSTDGFSGRVEAGESSVFNGAEIGYTFRASVNLPLSDTLAVRASAFTRLDPGYIDNPTLGINGTNEDHAAGGRLGALWTPSSTLSVKLNATYQKVSSHGTNDADSISSNGEMQQDYERWPSPFDKETQTYSAVVKYQFGTANLTSLTSYNTESSVDSADFTGPLSSITGITGVSFPFIDLGRTNKFSQEFRLSSPIGSHIDGMIGLFYTHEYSPDAQAFLETNTMTAATISDLGYGPFPGTSAEYAAFGDLTFHVTDRFDVQTGVRDSQLKQTYNSSFYGPLTMLLFGVPSPVIAPEEVAKNHAFTYLVTPSFKVTPDLMVYARVATGYRAGGSNGVEEEAGIPETYNPDLTTNYEIGAKGDFLDHTLTVDGSIYYIDWKDIQIGLLSPDNVGYTGNAGAAKSQGLEMSVESRPFDGLRLAGWVAFNDAVLTAYPAAAVAAGTYAYPGDRLPYTSRFSSHVSVDEEFPLATNLTGFVGGSVSYLSGRWDRFAPVDVPRNYLPAYARTDLHAGVDYESWKVNFYANNVMNRLGLLQGQLNMPVSGAWYIPPRTIGISVARNF